MHARIKQRRGNNNNTKKAQPDYSNECMHTKWFSSEQLLTSRDGGRKYQAEQNTSPATMHIISRCITSHSDPATRSQTHLLASIKRKKKYHGKYSKRVSRAVEAVALSPQQSSSRLRTVRPNLWLVVRVRVRVICVSWQCQQGDDVPACVLILG